MAKLQPLETIINKTLSQIDFTYGIQLRTQRFEGRIQI